jgi:hypothetical protein
MKFHVLAAIPFVAVTCLVLHIGEAQNLNLGQPSGETRATRIPFVIYVPDNPAPPTSPTELQSTNNRGVTTVEIVRSVEVKLDGSNESNVRGASSDTGDLLFSDTDDDSKATYMSEQNTARNNKNNRAKASPVLLLTPNDTNDKYQENYRKSDPKRIFHKILTVDGLDFNSRILLGNILIRQSNNEIEDHKYSYFSDPNVSDNKYHTTYIKQNNSSTFNKSRINVKFPPKIFPLNNMKSQQNRRNKTSVISNHVSQSQRTFYHSRIGKQSQIKQNDIQMQNTVNENNQNPSEATPSNIPQAQSKIEKLQALTHWDFGKRTPNSSTDDDSYAPNSGKKTPDSSSGDDSYASNFDKKTPDSSTDDDSYAPTSGRPISPSANKNANDFATELPQLMHPARSTLQPIEWPTPKSITENVIKTSVGPQGIPQNTFTKHQRVPIYNSINSIQTFPVFPTVNSIKSTQDYQDVNNGNIIRQQPEPNAFPNTHVQDYDNDIRNGNIQETNKRIYGSEATAQNYVPVINVGQQSEQQHGVRNNWQSVYFVPHVALQQPKQQQQLPTVFTLQPVTTGGATQTIPFIIHQNYPRLYQAAVLNSSPAVSAPNGVVYEGKVLCTRGMKTS